MSKNKKSIAKSVMTAETALAVYQNETFSKLASDIFTRPIVNGLALAHIKKAILNVGVVIELCKTTREAQICLDIANRLNDLCAELHSRDEDQTK